jgi:hypothetical protein
MGGGSVKKLRRYIPLIVPIVAMVLIIALIIWFFNRQVAPETLAKNRDMAIIMSSVLLAFGMFLFSVMIAIVIWLILILKDKIIPILEATNETVSRIKETTDSVAVNVVDTSQRVKTTTDFVTEEVAAPLIKAYGMAAQGRAWMRVVTGRKPRSEGSPISRAFRKPE